MKLKQISGGTELEVSEATFGQKDNETLVHQVVTAYRAAGRAGTKARSGVTVANSSSSPARCARALDYGQSSARLTNPATTGLSTM